MRCMPLLGTLNARNGRKVQMFDRARWENGRSRVSGTITGRDSAVSILKSLQRRPDHHDARTVLFQVPNGIGLGHLNRASAIALAMRKVTPHLRAIFAVDGTSHGLLEACDLPYIAMPRPGMLAMPQTGGLWTKTDDANLGDKIAGAILQTLAPALVVYDCFPNPYFVDAVLDLKIATILCLRDMLDPEIYAQKKEVAKVLESCLSIIVPHDREETTLPTSAIHKAVYVGNIVRDLPANPVPVHVRFNLPSTCTIVVTAGGGGHESALIFLNRCIRAVETVRRNRIEIFVVVIPGPLFNKWEELVTIPAMRVIPFCPDFMDICATASLVLAQAGYNSLNELICLGTPTITIPAARRFDDQFKRARRLGENWANIHMGALDPFEKLCEQIELLVQEGSPRIRRETPNGAYRAAHHIDQSMKHS